MKYVNMSHHNNEKFRHLIGIDRDIFEKLVDVLKVEHAMKKSKGGRPNHLCIEDMLMMTVEYLREYRTYLQIAGDYGLCESNAYRTIKWTESVLLKNKIVLLSSRKAMLTNENECEIIAIDPTDKPKQKVKKNKEVDQADTIMSM